MKVACFIFLVSFICGCSVHKQPNNPDEMVHNVFDCLKAKDEKAFMALCPDSIPLVRIMKKFAENTRAKIETERKAWRERTKNYPQGSATSFDKTDSILDASLRSNYSPEGIKQIQERYRNSFRFLLAKGEKRGINWNGVALTNYTIDTTKPDQQTMSFFLRQSGYKSANSIIHFKAGRETFKMGFGEVLFLPEEDGWYGGILFKLVREEERLEDDHDSEEKTEITLTDVVDEPPPPPPPVPPIPQKPKTKRKKI